MFFFIPDLGSNSGPYSLLSVALGHTTISVDPIITNQALLYNSLGTVSENYIGATKMLNTFSYNIKLFLFLKLWWQYLTLQIAPNIVIVIPLNLR